MARGTKVSPKLTRDGRTAFITVTPEIITESKKADSSHCAIAEAIKAKIPDAQYVSVDLQTIRFSDQNYRYTYLTPRKAQQFIVKFDQGLKLNPISFYIRDSQVTNRYHKPEGAAKLPAKGALQKRVSKTDGTISRKIGGKTPPRMGGGTRRAYGLRAFDR